MPLPRVATYRIQLGPAFDFAAAASVVEHLARFGFSHLYCSPVAEAVPGSSHGYDVVDPTTVRGELGGREGLWALAGTVAERGMGLLLDIVPNHVSSRAGPANPWWWRVLADGPAAATAGHFDIDWAHGDGRIIVPVLGAPVETELAAGTLRIEGDEIRYHDHRFPVREGTTGSDPATVLADQHYRLAPWRQPERNVRRFFTIDDLVAIRPEVDTVRRAVQQIAGDLRDDGLLDGVRIDHIDGLADPLTYLRELRARLGDDAWILVEKIVVPDETLPRQWPVDGTTGYEWIRLLDHLFTDPVGEDSFTEHLERITGDPRPYHEAEQEAVREVLTEALAPDVARVARTVAAELEPAPPIDPESLTTVIVELTAALGRYRTYLGPDPAPEHPDLARIRAAAAQATTGLDAASAASAAAVVTVLTRGGEATRRWQQLSGPALAKGGEDRALYRWIRLAAHNEVGGDPGIWDLPLDAFHRAAADAAQHRPFGLLAGSTHDTKRSEEVRARLLALSGRPEQWWAWHDHLDESVAAVGVDPASRHLALQTVVGAWPIDEGRLGDHLVKAAREADVATSWTDPDPDHENGLRALAAALTSEPHASTVAAFVAELESATRSIVHAQLVLRATAPGVPDVYQGGEGRLLTLVDPDNRAPLQPERLHARLDAATITGPVWAADDPKPAVLKRCLDTRRRHPDCFGPAGGYEPVAAAGRHADHVIGFTRSAGTERVVVIVSRYPDARPGGWADTAVDLDGRYRDVLAETAHGPGRTSLHDLLGEHPAAVLLPEAN